MLNLEHPDHISDWIKTKEIRRGSMQAIEDKAITEYMRAYEAAGKEEAEKVFFNHFNKGYGTGTNTMEVNERRYS